MAANRLTVLVVEDDEETLNVIARTLAAAGRDVVWARNGADALKLLAKQAHPIALIIVDVVLPGISGPELVEKVLRRYPGARAIYVSAYDTETVREHGVDPGKMDFLPKPYEPADLLRRVAEALGEDTP